MIYKTKHSVLNVSITAATDLLTPHKFVGVDGNYASAGAFAVGILEAATDQGHQAPVMAYGIGLVLAGGTIAAGSGVECGADGTAVTHNTGQLLGYAIDAATSAGDVIRVKLL